MYIYKNTYIHICVPRHRHQRIAAISNLCTVNKCTARGKGTDFYLYFYFIVYRVNIPRVAKALTCILLLLK